VVTEEAGKLGWEGVQLLFPRGSFSGLLAFALRYVSGGYAICEGMGIRSERQARSGELESQKAWRRRMQGMSTEIEDRDGDRRKEEEEVSIPCYFVNEVGC
jgi:hypothetical protein